MIPEHSSLVIVIFISASLVLLAIPGPAVFYIVGRRIGQGRSAGLVSAQGIFVGTCVHVAAAVGLASDSLWGYFAGSVADRLRAHARWSRSERYLCGGMLISLRLATVAGHSPHK